MGFNEAKRLFIHSLVNMDFIHFTDRLDIRSKNKLHTKKVNAEFVLDKIKRCRGFNHKSEQGCAMVDDDCMHVFKIDGWYLNTFY